MTTVSIVEVALQPDGSLSIQPDLHENPNMEFIWRAANGVRWDAAIRSLIRADEEPSGICSDRVEPCIEILRGPE